MKPRLPIFFFVTTSAAALFASPILHSGACLAQDSGEKSASPPADFKKLPDRSAKLQQLIDSNNGNLTLANGKYRLTQPLVFDLTKHGAVRVTATGGTTLIMDGPGPALKFIGGHEGTAAPKSFKPETWEERMPLIEGLEILGIHPEADGIELFQTVQPTISHVAIRGCRHGIHLVTRNRNVVISDCHLYENSGIGVYLDDVNLHQINISNCHVSYNRQGGIVVRDGNVRNLQVSNCDLEGNMPEDDTPTNAANFLIDVSQSDESRSVAEVALTGCTIQHSANYSGKDYDVLAPGGANIRILGKEAYPVNMVTITGNVISDTTLNTHISWTDDLTLQGNVFFAPQPDNLLVENSSRIVATGNVFNPRQFEREGTLRFRHCSDVVFADTSLHALLAPEGSLVLEDCAGFTLSGLSFTDCVSGIVLKRTQDVLVSGCRAARLPDGTPALSADAESGGIVLNANRFPTGTQLPAGQ